MDITQMILDDHHEQRRLFGIIEEIEATDTRSLASVWRRLATFLEVHAKAEEVLFYPELLSLGNDGVGRPSPVAETEDAIKDHNDIRDAVAAVNRHDVGSDSWFEAVAKANKANSDHAAEEEREGLTDVRREVDIHTRHALAVKFIAFEVRNVDGVASENVRPDDYIRSNAGTSSDRFRSDD